MAKLKTGMLSGWNESKLSELLIDHLAGILRVSSADIDPSKNFDEYGLDSIDAVIATESIGRQLAIELPPEFLFRNNNVNAVVQALLKERDASQLADAQHDEQSPIFFFPGAGGKDEPNLIRFRTECATYAEFDVVSIDDWRDWIEHDRDFEAIANRARRHIETVAGNGPLRLVGYSQGGWIALATAIALQSAGRPVRFVGLLDSATLIIPPSERKDILRLTITALKNLRPYFWARIRGIRTAYRGYFRVRILHLLWELLRTEGRRRKMLLFIAHHGNALFRGRNGVRLEQIIRRRLFWEMWSTWVSQTGDQLLHAPVVLFRSEKRHDDLGWGAFCADLRVIPVGGDHYTMFQGEHLGELIAKFVAVLEGTQANNHQPAVTPAPA